jgi:alkanesulfonate monooxygenase SsuD/methylene tetrahydromethanopterin reductase-like flavin-dependent oxidoreductase (luciferase family)
MCSALIICRDTEAVAQAAYARILEHGDWEAARKMLSVLGVQSQSFTHGFEDRVKRFCAGYGTNPILGTPEQVTEQLGQMSAAGVDGVVFGFLDYNEELKYFDQAVMPLLRQAGLRK